MLWVSGWSVHCSGSSEEREARSLSALKIMHGLPSYLHKFRMQTHNIAQGYDLLS